MPTSGAAAQVSAGSLPLMKSKKILPPGQISAWILVIGGFFPTTHLIHGQELQHLTITQPGGLPGLPVMTGVQQVTNGVSVTWFGPSGYYQLFQKQALADPDWQSVGGLRLTNQAILSANHSSAFFRVSGPSPQYAGAQACAECHAGVHDTVLKTRHAGAFTNALFVAQGGQTDNSCVSCHTVGAGLPTGFVSKSKTPHLLGVQCENCHGPAARHAANPGDFTVRPRVEIASTVCGGCHDAKSVPAHVVTSHPPYFAEWNTSAHRAVRADLQTSFVSGPSAANSMASCGRCHSGTVRNALMENQPLSGGHEAGAIGVACTTCHDPHKQHIHTNVLAGVQSFTNTLTGFRYLITNNSVGVRYTNQLREALASLRDYRTGGNFTTNYNAQINGCAQCHNDRGASYFDTNAPPHHSPQYNMLLGTVGEIASGVRPNLPATHSRIEKQCVACHMPASDQKAGHKFTVTAYDACASCHGSAANARNFVIFLKWIITSLGQEVKDGLDEWATNRAPAEIRHYGPLAWEYVDAGQLSDPSGTRHGPSAQEQHFIPANIQKARFNLYLVINDGSYGVHNGPHAIKLLEAAHNWVQTELDQ
jgi:hypothetical protein